MIMQDHAPNPKFNASKFMQDYLYATMLPLLVADV